MRLKPKAKIRLRAPAEPPTIGEFFAEQAVRRRRLAAPGHPQFNVSALTLDSSGGRKGAAP